MLVILYKFSARFVKYYGNLQKYTIRSIMSLLTGVDHPLLNSQNLKILKENDINNVMDFLEEETERLASIMRLSYNKILDLRLFIIDKYKPPLLNALEYKQLPVLATNIMRLDEALNGGLPMGKIIELRGLPGSGKTLLLLNIVCNVTSISKSSVIFIDTKNDFSVTKIHEILKGNGYQNEDLGIILHRIKVVKIWNMCELIHFFHDVRRHRRKNEIQLIVIDSLPSLMLQHQGEQINESLGLLNNLVNVMRFLVIEYQLSIVIVNLLTYWKENEQEGEINRADTKYPTLGKYWRYIPSLHLSSELFHDKTNRKLELTIRKPYCDKITKLQFEFKSHGRIQ